MPDNERQFATLQGPTGETIAYHVSAGKSPGVVFLGGLMSDMTGTKAITLEAHCAKVGRAFVRFDYSGHGQSSGKFVDGTIGRWHGDTLAVLDSVTTGPQILVGSSMGGWQMLLAARARPERIAGMVGVAVAPDFTEDLMWQELTPGQKRQLHEHGILNLPSDYGDDPYPISRALIEEGRDHLLLRDTLPIRCPTHLLHGMQDSDVPWRTSLRVAEAMEGEDVILTFVKDGDHRLSRDADLARLTAALDAMIGRLAVH